MKHPKEIEINFSNVCAAECIICSRLHGSGNKFFMEEDVFSVLLEQMKEIEFSMIQTSGNGEAFLNPHYLDYIERLRDMFPKKQMWTYNNFSMMTKDRADRIIAGNLFNRIHVRIDSLQKWVFERNSNLNKEMVFKNLEYFLSKNKTMNLVILYNNINDYYARCKDILESRPVRDFFTDEELAKVRDEEKEIEKYFKQYDCPISVCRVGHSLWGERQSASPDPVTLCPKWNVINNVTWVCPNGDVDVCCYDDTQALFVCGNILEDSLLSIFNGESRKEILRKIENREWKSYPCVNPKCCNME